MTGIELLIKNPKAFWKKQINKIKHREQLKEDIVKYEENLQQYISLNTRDKFAFEKKYEHKILSEYRDEAGFATSYFWQDLWGARRVYGNKPQTHYDIGSRIDGFISHLMLFSEIKIHLIDIRPLSIELPGVFFTQADATNLEGIMDDSIESLSALCSLEHFGLGRYGDPIDPEACFKAFKSIQRVVKKNGYIYISLPVGEDHVCFNAHRVFSPHTVIEEFGACICEEFSVVDMDRDYPLIENCDVMQFSLKENVDHVMGLFVFRKA